MMGAYEVVQQLEQMRKKKNSYGLYTLICMFCPIIVFNIIPFFGPLTPFLMFFGVAFGVIFFAGKNAKVTKEYKKLYKENFVVSVLNEVFDNVTYDYEKGFNSDYVRSFGLTRLGNRFRSEDYLRASYKGINFEQADVVIQYHSSGKNSHTTTYFRGRMFAFDFPFKNVSTVQVFTEAYPYRANSIGNLRMNKIQMESDYFNKNFDVLAFKDMEAFYVLTPQMMEKIQSIKEQYNHVAMHFMGNKLFVGIWTSGDAFDGDPKRKINYVEEKQACLRDAHVITDIIDALGLMREDGVMDNYFDS